MKKDVSLFIAGTGKVGKELLKKISNKKIINTKDNLLRFRISGVANRSKMFLSKGEIESADWITLLNKQGDPTNIDFFVSAMEELKLPDSVFVDCTDGNEISKYYNRILKFAPIVTSNKSANSGSYRNYLNIRKTIRKYKTDFRYSANVGVGLPTIDIINSLLVGGDKITAIEGLFSSTMNFLLDKLTKTNKKFSQLLKEATSRGLTEPDPRNDLNGIDTARKLLILARETGAKIEMYDIKTENLVPVILRNINSLDKFFESIKICDNKFDELKKKAIKNKSKLVYSASYSKNSSSVRIKMVNEKHPFYSASANEKVVLIYSEFYKNYPLIVKGTSGGAKATAEVLLSDIIRVVHNKQHTN